MAWCGSLSDTPATYHEPVAEFSAPGQAAAMPTVAEMLGICFGRGVTSVVGLVMNFLEQKRPLLQKHARWIVAFLAFIFFVHVLNQGNHAQGEALLDQINTDLSTDVSPFYTGAFQVADAIFSVVAFISVLLVFLDHLKEYRTAAGSMNKIVEAIINVGLPWIFLKIAETAIPGWMSIADSVSSTITGMAATTPDAVFTTGFTLAKQMFISLGQTFATQAASHGVNVGAACLDMMMFLMVGASAIVVTVCFVLLGVELLVAYAQGYISVSIGAAQLGWTASRHTASFTQAYWSAIMNVIVRIIVTRAIISIGVTEVHAWIEKTIAAGINTHNDHIATSAIVILQIAVMAIVLYVLTIKVTALASAQLSGAPAFGGSRMLAGALSRPAGNFMGGVAGGIGGAAWGGMTAGAAMAAAGGNLGSTLRAASYGSASGAFRGATQGARKGGLYAKRATDDIKNS